jgi:hypothetical protein
MIRLDSTGLPKGKKKIAFSVVKEELEKSTALTMGFFTPNVGKDSDREFIFLDLRPKKIRDLLGLSPAIANGGGEGSYRTAMNPPGRLGIVRHPVAADFGSIHGGTLKALPAYTPDSGEMWQVDVRSTDISTLDLRGRTDDLLHASFDSKTRWPENLPAGFDPAALMELGKNPGLGLRTLHKKGITGRGIGIAIIDQGLLVDHVEYKDRLKLYEEIHSADVNSSMHGPAVASIAVGKNVGVAPEADLYFIAETHGTGNGGNFVWDLGWLAKSIDRIVEINTGLPKAKKIRVISISLGVGTHLPGGDIALEAIERAKNAGIYTVYVGEPFFGLGRMPMKTADEFRNYLPGSFLAQRFYDGALPGGERLWIPMDSRCTASPTGSTDYAFYSEGGMSWTVPYIAGNYALACQVKPDLTPELFLKTALETGETIDIPKNGNKYRLGKIINPGKLIEALKSL